MRTRRQFLKDLAGGAAVVGSGAFLPSLARGANTANPAAVGPSALPAGTLETSFLEALPGKRPLEGGLARVSLTHQQQLGFAPDNGLPA